MRTHCQIQHYIIQHYIPKYTVPAQLTITGVLVVAARLPRNPQLTTTTKSCAE
jgi:hypothetical protein